MDNTCQLDYNKIYKYNKKESCDMKNYIRIFLTILMIVFLTACAETHLASEPQTTEGSQTEEIQTTPAAVDTTPEVTLPPETTEETAPEETIPSLEETLLQDENATIIEQLSWHECKSILVEMGFLELRLGQPVKESHINPIKLIYNETSFYLELEGIVISEYGEVTYEPGWILIGTKAQEESNVTALNFADYSQAYSNTFRGDKAASTRAKRVLGDNYPRIIDWECYNQNAQGGEFLFYSSEYYPTTTNLYNYYCIKTFGPNEFLTEINYMDFTYFWEEIVWMQWAEARKAGLLYAFKLGNYGYVCEPGMNFVDWANSQYNIDGWIFTDDHVGWLQHPETLEVFCVAYDKDGNRYLIEDFTGYTTMSLEEAKAKGFTP